MKPSFTALALAALMLPAAAHAQSGYVFTKILDNETVRPDGQGTFYTGFPSAMPALDGNFVIFEDLTNSATSLWSYQAFGSGGFVKLADFNTPVPAGVGNFTRLDDQTFRARDGIVLFEGLDSNTSGSTHGGLYSIGEAGGPIEKVIDYNTQAPDADGPFIQSNANNEITAGFFEGDYDLEGGVIAFHGLTANNGDGVYSVNLDGTGLTRLADKTTLGTPPPFPVSQYYNAALHNGTAVFYGGTVFGGYGICSSPVGGGLSSPNLLATPSTPLPGGQSPETTTVYFTGFGRFDHTTGNFIFAAHDSSGINGLYNLAGNALSGGVFTKVVDNQTALPGSSVPASYFDGTPFSADGGQVAFVTATDESANQVGALYVSNGASITRVIGVGDTLDGIGLTGITLGAHALSGGQIVFGAGSYLQGPDGLPRFGAIYLATPVSMTADLALTLTAPSAPAAIGQQVTFTIGVTNNGPAAAPATSIADSLPAGLQFVSDDAGSSSSGPGGLLTINGAALAVGASATYHIVAQVTAAGSLVDAATVTGSVADANLANNTAQTTVTAVALPTVTVAATAPTAHFGSGETGVFKLAISPAPANPLKVSYKLGGTAVNGTDYAFLPSHIKVKAGKAKKGIDVIPQGDGNGASKLTVKLTLLPGNGYVLGSATSVKVKILAPTP